MGRRRKAIGRGWARVNRWVVRADFVVLVAVLVAATAGWAFLKIADEVTEGDHGHADEWVVAGAREPFHPDRPTVAGGSCR